MFRMLSGRVFHSRGPATANALSSNFVRVLGTSNWFANWIVPSDINRQRPGRDDVLVVVRRAPTADDTKHEDSA